MGGSSAGGGAGAPVRSSYPEGGGDPDDYSGDYNDAGVDDGAPASVQDRRAGVRPKRPASAHVRRVLSSKGAFFVGVAVLVVAACAVIGFGYPAVGHSWKWPVALGGTLGVAVLGFLLWRARPHLSRRSLLITGVAAALVVLIFSLGAGHSVVLNGKVYPSTSKTAQAYVMSEELRRDLYTIASYDRLLTYNLTDARAHYSEYATAIADMQAMTNKWGNQSLNNLPDPNLIAAITNTKVAANYTADALQAQQQLLTVTDPQLVAQVTSDRETVANSAIAAAHALVNVANDYGFALYGQVHE